MTLFSNIQSMHPIKHLCKNDNFLGNNLAVIIFSRPTKNVPLSRFHRIVSSEDENWKATGSILKYHTLSPEISDYKMIGKMSFNPYRIFGSRHATQSKYIRNTKIYTSTYEFNSYQIGACRKFLTTFTQRMTRGICISRELQIAIYSVVVQVGFLNLAYPKKMFFWNEMEMEGPNFSKIVLNIFQLCGRLSSCLKLILLNYNWWKIDSISQQMRTGK